MAPTPPNLRSSLDLGRVFRSPHLEGLHGLRPIPQTRSYTCGAAAVATAMQFLGKEANELQCAQALKTNSAVGTTPENIIIYCRHRGLKARAYTGVPLDVVLNRCRTGKITLVDWNDYGGHWVIVAGYEPHMKAIILADPARPRSCFAVHSLEHFQDNWHCDGFGRSKRYERLAVLIDAYAGPQRHRGTKGVRTIPRGQHLDSSARVLPYDRMITRRQRAD